MGVEEVPVPSLRSSSQVGKAIRSFSQALGLWKSDYDFNTLFRNQEGGRTTINFKILLELLENGTNLERASAIEEINKRLVDIFPEERLEAWELIRAKVDLKKENIVRREAFKLFNSILKHQKFVNGNIIVFYTDISENINLTGNDHDIVILLKCLCNLVTVSSIESLEKYSKYPLDNFLVELFQCVMNLNLAEAEMLIIEVVAQCLSQDPELFSSAQMHTIFEKSINVCIKTNETELLMSFIDLSTSILLTGFDYKDFLYSMVSILGCANGIDEIESTSKCNELLDKLLEIGEYTILKTLCDVISQLHDDQYKHREGNRPIIGCIRLLSYASNNLGKSSSTSAGTLATKFFNNFLSCIFTTLEKAASKKDDCICIEIVKFIDQVLEKPYVIDGYYEYFVEQNQFWELLDTIDCNNNNTLDKDANYQLVQNELSNKLQNLKLNNFYSQKLVKYLEKNYDILTSYNIEFILQYYSEHLLLVCGASNWRINCKNIFERYFTTCPLQVHQSLADALLYCLPLKIDDSSLRFYIDLIFYKSAINIGITLDNEMICKMVEILIKIDANLFEEIVSQYKQLIIQGKDANGLFFHTLIWATLLKNSFQVDGKVKTDCLFDAIIEISCHFPEMTMSVIPLMNTIFLKSLRVDGGGGCYFDFPYVEKFLKELTISDVDLETITKSITFLKSETVPLDGTFNLFQYQYANLNAILNTYIHTFKNTSNWHFFSITAKQLRLQLFNFAIVDEMPINAINDMIDIITLQMQESYNFKFDKLQVKMALIDVLYGIFPYVKFIDSEKMIKLMRTIMVDYHFCHDDFTSFIISNLYENPMLMSHFILPMLKMMEQEVSIPLNFCVTMEIVMHFLKLCKNGNYIMKSKYKEIITAMTVRVLRYEHGEAVDDFKRVQWAKNMARLVNEELNLPESSTLEKKRVVSLKFATFVDCPTSCHDFWKQLEDNIDEDFSFADHYHYHYKNIKGVIHWPPGVLLILLDGEKGNSASRPIFTECIVLNPVKGNEKYIEVTFKMVNNGLIVVSREKLADLVGALIRIWRAVKDCNIYSG